MRVTSSWFESENKARDALGISRSEAKKPRTQVHLCPHPSQALSFRSLSAR